MCLHCPCASPAYTPPRQPPPPPVAISSIGGHCRREKEAGEKEGGEEKKRGGEEGEEKEGVSLDLSTLTPLQSSLTSLLALIVAILIAKVCPTPLVVSTSS